MQASLAKPLRAAPTRRVVASRRAVAPKAFSDVNTVIGGGESPPIPGPGASAPRHWAMGRGWGNGSGRHGRTRGTNARR